MGLFLNPHNRQEVFDIMRALVEEWGEDHVVICLPYRWSREIDIRLARVSFEYGPPDTASVRVNFDSLRLQFDIRLPSNFL